MGVREEVNWKMSADSGEMLRSLQQTVQGLDKIADRFDKVGQAGKRAGSDTEAGAGAAIGKWFSIAKAIDLATGAVRTYMDVNRQFMRESSDATLSQDQSFRAVRVVGKIFDDQQAKRVESSIAQTATKNAVSIQQGNQAAYQLASGGIPMKEIIEGGGLDEFLKMAKTLQAANPGASMQDTARASTMFLSGTGQEMNAKSLHGLGRSMAGLFETNVELKDLEEIAAVGKGLKELGGALPEDTLAMFSVLRDTLPAAEAATHFRNSVLNLATAKDEPKSKQALSRMGLKPTDVDFVGEDMETVFTRLKGGVSNLSPEERPVMLNRLFGQRNIIGAIAAMEGVEKMPGRRAMAADETAYERASALAQSGPAADRQRAENRETASKLYKGAEGIITGGLDRDAALRGQGLPEIDVWMKRQGRDIATSLGLSADFGEHMTPTSLLGYAGKAKQAVFGKSDTEAAGEVSLKGPIQIEIIGPNGSRQQAEMKPVRALGD